MKRYRTIFLHFSYNWQLQQFIERVYATFNTVKRTLLTSSYVEYKVSI